MAPVTADSPIWVVQTKLLPPCLPAAIVPRPRLSDRLVDELLLHRLTLLSAPAGYGKTTLLAGLAQATPDLPLAWLALDEEDNNPVQLLAVLIGALQRLNPQCGVAAQAWLPACASRSPDMVATEMRHVIGVLINEILETLPLPFVLVLDDLHHITEPTIFQALDYLFEHLPAQMHVAVATRCEPPLALARLRGRGQLAELRMADLRFTPEETALFLNDVLRLDLSTRSMRALQGRLEGWAVGLNLLASSLDRLPTSEGRNDLIGALARSERQVFDFLAEEVLSRQEPAIRRFLLQTSILAELTPALCQAVTGRPDAGDVLDEISRRNLFLIAVAEGDERRAGPAAAPPSELGRGLPAARTYRYHALFADFLRQHLAREMPNDVAALHGRAARTQTAPARIIQHYLAAEMWDEAAGAIFAIFLPCLHRGLIDTLESWVRALPEATRDAWPWMWHILASCYLQRGDLERTQLYSERSLTYFERGVDEGGTATALATLAMLAFIRSDYARAQALVARGLPLHGIPYSHLRLAMTRAWLALFVRRDLEAAHAEFETALDSLQAAEDPNALFAMAHYLLQGFVVPAASVARFEQICLVCPGHAGWSDPMQQASDDLLSYIYLRRGQLALAAATADRAMAARERNGGFPQLGMTALVVAPAAHAALGDHEDGERSFVIFQDEVAIAVRNGLEAAASLYALARIRWLQGRIDDAGRFHATMCAFGPERESPLARLLRTMLEGQLALAAGDYPAAERLLREACALEEQVPLAPLYGSPRLHLASLYRLWRRPQAALALMEPLLAECEADDKAGLIVQEGIHVLPLLRLAIECDVRPAYAGRLMGLLGFPQPTQAICIPETGATLTRREIEVLQLLAAGASNQAIAEQLVTSLPTVKTHVAHILAKLNVSSRTEAALRARELKLVAWQPQAPTGRGD